MIKITANSPYATFECHYEDSEAEAAFIKVHELQETGWDNVNFEHLGGLDLNQYYKRFLENLEVIKIELNDNRN